MQNATIWPPSTPLRAFSRSQSPRAEQAATNFRLAALAGDGSRADGGHDQTALRPGRDRRRAVSLASHRSSRADRLGGILFRRGRWARFTLAMVSLGLPRLRRRRDADGRRHLRSDPGQPPRGCSSESGGLLFLLVGLLVVLVAGKAIDKSWIAVPALAASSARPSAPYMIKDEGLALSGASGADVSDDRLRASRCSRNAVAPGDRPGRSGDGRRRARRIHAITPISRPPIGVAAAAATWLHRRLALRAVPGQRGRRPMRGSRCSRDIASSRRSGRRCTASASLMMTRRAPALEAALARLGPHPTLAGITEVMGFGHPMARRTRR